MQVAEASRSLASWENNPRRLSEIFAPCFTLILQLRASRHYGDPEVLRKRIKELLERSEREGQRAGIDSEDLRTVKFALVAFVDETILASEWPQKEYWLARPLQLELYNRFDAGEEFFVRLEGLRTRPKENVEVLEVYYLCLALGFKGQYQIHGQEQLRILIEDIYAQLARIPGMTSNVLAPNGRPRDQIATEVKSKLPAWVIVAFAATIGLIVYLYLYIDIGNVAGEVSRSIQQLSSLGRLP